MSSVDQLTPPAGFTDRSLGDVDGERRREPHPGRAGGVRSLRQEDIVRQEDIYKRCLIATDLAAALGALLILRALSGGHLLQWDLALAPLVVALAKLLGRYDGHNATMRRSTLDEAPQLMVLAAVWALLWSLLSVPLDIPSGAVRGGVGVLWLALCALLIAGRGVVHLVANRLRGPERVLIVGSDLARRTLTHSLSADPGTHLKIVGYLPLEPERHPEPHCPPDMAPGRARLFGFDDLEEVVDVLRVERVLLVPAHADSDATLSAVQRITDLDLRVSLLPRLLEVVGSAVQFDDVAGMTVLGLRRPGLTRSSRLIKRSIDIASAGLLTVAVSPLLLALAIAVKLDSPGPVLFRQTRVGRHGRHFQILKFRSMVDGAEARRAALSGLNETEGLFKLAADPRVTRIGRLMRRTSIDELPQLINVLRGDMSLVGPRPLIVGEDALVVGRHRGRLAMSPGMTGPWQILGPRRPPLAEMIKTDYLYAVNWSLWLDVKILLRTLGHIRGGHGR